jgi:hypothetical protein
VIKNVKIYSVEEGATGVLYLTDSDGNIEVFQPNCDLDKTQKYLYQYHECLTSNNIKIKNSFTGKRVDWYPSTISMLYWQFFYQYVKYESLIEMWKREEVYFKDIAPGRFRNLIQQLELKTIKYNYFNNMIRSVVSSLVMIRNNLLVKFGKEIVLLLGQSLDDFRTTEIYNNLNLNFSVVRLVPLKDLKISDILFNSSLCALPLQHSSVGVENLFDIKLKTDTPWVFRNALNYTNKIISQHLSSYNLLRKYFSNKEYKLLVGLDDCNYVYPALYAAQENKIKCFGIQHGAYVQRHEAYVMNCIGYHQWYDYLLVWGDYWKKVFLENNKIFPENNVLISTNKHNYQYEILAKNNQIKSILIPYEFLADTILIGRFIEEFYAKGFKIYFKPRSDESIDDQIEAYRVKDAENKINIVKDITPEIMSNIDIIAGTMTTLLYDLLPYNKPIWILKTPFRLQEDMVDNGLARMINWNDLDNINEIYCKDIKKNISIDKKIFSFGKSVSDVINEMQGF